MRDQADLERIAVARGTSAREAWERAQLVQARLKADTAAAGIGPPEPIGSRIYPLKTNDWGLNALRDRCYQRLREKRLAHLAPL